MSGRSRAAIAAASAALVLTLAACSTATPFASFDPASACTTDGRMPGAYPDLEALLPDAYEGKAATTVDSGRNCTPDALGTLADAGIDGVRFAGATWPLGGSSGLTVAVFEADGLEPGEMIDFYGVGAQRASRTDKLTVADITVGGQPGRRLDVLRSDGSGQSILAWSDGTDRVMVLLASDVGDTAVLEAADAFAAH